MLCALPQSRFCIWTMDSAVWLQEQATCCNAQYEGLLYSDAVIEHPSCILQHKQAVRSPVFWPVDRGSLGTLGACFCPVALAADAGVRLAEGVPHAGAAWRLPKATAYPWALAPASLPLRLPCKANCSGQAVRMHALMPSQSMTGQQSR